MSRIARFDMPGSSLLGANLALAMPIFWRPVHFFCCLTAALLAVWTPRTATASSLFMDSGRSGFSITIDDLMDDQVTFSDPDTSYPNGPGVTTTAKTTVNAVDGIRFPYHCFLPFGLGLSGLISLQGWMARGRHTAGVQHPGNNHPASNVLVCERVRL